MTRSGRTSISPSVRPRSGERATTGGARPGSRASAPSTSPAPIPSRPGSTLRPCASPSRPAHSEICHGDPGAGPIGRRHGPKSTTDGVPSAVARWATPVSPQTTRPRPRRRRPARAGRCARRPRVARGRPLRRAVPSGRSAPEPVITTRRPSARSGRRSRPTRGGQRRAGAAAPGWITVAPRATAEWTRGGGRQLESRVGRDPGRRASDTSARPRARRRASAARSSSRAAARCGRRAGGPGRRPAAAVALRTAAVEVDGAPAHVRSGVGGRPVLVAQLALRIDCATSGDSRAGRTAGGGHREAVASARRAGPRSAGRRGRAREGSRSRPRGLGRRAARARAARPPAAVQREGDRRRDLLRLGQLSIDGGLYCSSRPSKKAVSMPPGISRVTPTRPAISAASARVKPTTPNLLAQ